MHFLECFMHFLSLTLVLASYAEYNIIEKDDVRFYNVLGTFSIRTITACVMRCRTHKFCTHSSVEDNGDKKTCSLMVRKEKGDDGDVNGNEKVIMTEVKILTKIL